MAKPQYKLNRMASTIHKVQSILPTSLHPAALTYIFNSTVKLAKTAGIRIDYLSHTRSTLTLPNEKRIQNHIGGLHACSMALAAESATGVLIGMNVRDTHIPLIKTMKVDFVRRCEGGITAEASLSEEDYGRIHEEDRGEVWVPCKVVDESGEEPIVASMLWAWVAKQKKSEP